MTKFAVQTPTRHEFLMKSWIILLVLITLVTYNSGRSRFRLIEYDESVDKTSDYKHCMRDCKKFCEADHDCMAKYASDNYQTACREGEGDDDTLHNAFIKKNKSFKACDPSPPAVIEKKHAFEPYDLWRLY
ncbi:hypothetical protein OS493_030739 [Desmophyllum pertusum]|uniref:Uncharacterized protein n=1 Tax=Desmophyllum pertusum TaxID=174260 RepID=A0A9X0CWP4_9CNID|nr:hypothetical protein OS493_030739 [Desmophyllum pertusum]